MTQDERDAEEARLDESLDETFPASDAPSNTVEVGVRVEPLPSMASVRDNEAAQRFELEQNGDVAFLVYEKTANSLTLVHTEVPPALRGHHLADFLVQAAVAFARHRGLRLVVVCPFARAYLKKHPNAG